MNEVRNAIHREQRRQMTKDLDERVDGWRAQNEDPAFLQWLGGRDPLSGQTRQALLQNAWAAGDGTRVANIFEGYRSRGRQQGSQHNVGTGPGTAWGGSGSPTGYFRDWPTDGAPVIRGSQIKAFYDDVA